MDLKQKLLELVEYDPINGRLLAKITSGMWKKGRPVGHPYKQGYYVIRYKGKPFTVHRIIWELMRGPIPPTYCIDHINGDTHDNHLENLRCVPRQLNQKNAKRPVTNTSGHIGVRWQNSQWHAFIRSPYGHWSLGFYNQKSTAIFARKIAQLLIGGYHENHGRDVTMHHRTDRSPVGGKNGKRRLRSSPK